MPVGALTSQGPTPLSTGVITPNAQQVAASDTIAAAQFGPNGLLARVINGGGSPDTVTLVDPTKTSLGSAATNPSASVPNGASREFTIPVAAIDPSTQQATLNHSFITSVTIELKRI